ncbi:MAG: hypothetical protein ACLFUI_05290 [Halanaerobiales bacterium]
MRWNRFISHFVFVPLVAWLSGNFSLGLIVVGLTGLIWGFESGAMFVSLTTTFLVLLTGNINLEIIFLYAVTIAYLNREYKIFKTLDRGTSYFLLLFISILSYPVWRELLGMIPVSLLNELNIAGEVLLVAGLFLFIVRGKFLLENSVQRGRFFEYLLNFVCSVLGLMGIYILIPLWIGGNYLLDRYSKELAAPIVFTRKLHLLFIPIILIITSIAANFLLPIGFVTALFLLLIFVFVFRNLKQIPLVEMLYFSMILGIVAGRMGLLM